MSNQSNEADQTQRRERSNILIIISDEHRKDAMGCMGHPIVKTPNLDALAARGTLFTNAYTPSPMCVPTRAAIATGDHVHKTRHWDSASPYDGRIRSWMRHLRDQGIQTVSIGKLHFRSTEDDNGFSEEILPMHVVGGVGWPIGLLRETPQPYDAAAELAADVGVGNSTYTDYDREITKAAEAWLQKQTGSDQPWAAFVSLVSPHYPLTCPEEYFTMYDPAQIDLPVGYEGRFRPEHTELRNVAEFFDYEKYFDEQKMREAKAAYYGLTSFMDDCVGRILSALEKSGQADDTVVVYVSDHGDMMGDQGFWTKQVMYEQSTGVPMILAGPGVPEKRKVTTGASLVDLAATAVDVTGVSHDETSRDLPGISLRELALEEDNPDRTILSEYHDGGSTTGTFMIRWQRWKYVHYVGHDPQLFDLTNDPNELRDLVALQADDPQTIAALAEGEHRLRKICDPETVNTLCFADQKARIAELGGEEACLTAYCFNHTPTPGEQEKMRNSSAL
ncbi:sulfatase-like hydrolase/transferase [Ruegeria sp. HKCCD4884]|uniref:sulfatase-like hydrolase/transferase n=1 Tax=Ruegeria sp. HKCCD4884 TaxID=2683022 RepID=UPI0014924DBE|nr:sulfatase-like hydrolase/transferase [Ruegeria sp. HKCCD4884]NOD95082.1 sulfatase-like hydrolase/transferase [Ruegeria sp. HKCCD4884]